MHRAVTLFSGVLELLRNEKPLLLREDGTLFASFEPIAEEDDEPE